MEPIENTMVKMLETIPIENHQDAREYIQASIDNSLQPYCAGKSPAEIMEMRNSTLNLMNNIFNRVTIPLETKLVDEKEFLFYKLVDDKDLCPKLKSWERQDGKFLIKYKTHNEISSFTESNKEIVIGLVSKLHKLGIIHNDITKENIVCNEYEGIKLTGFSESMWIDSIDEQFLLNNLYGVPCSSIEELLNLELNKVNDIFEHFKNEQKISSNKVSEMLRRFKDDQKIEDDQFDEESLDIIVSNKKEPLIKK
jgi:tRNA A-37 threonylcarbamoyl transferase component Bud32